MNSSSARSLMRHCPRGLNQTAAIWPPTTSSFNVFGWQSSRHRQADEALLLLHDRGSAASSRWYRHGARNPVACVRSALGARAVAVAVRRFRGQRGATRPTEISRDGDTGEPRRTACPSRFSRSAETRRDRWPELLIRGSEVRILPGACTKCLNHRFLVALPSVQPSVAQGRSARADLACEARTAALPLERNHVGLGARRAKISVDEPKCDGGTGPACAAFRAANGAREYDGCLSSRCQHAG